MRRLEASNRYYYISTKETYPLGQPDIYTISETAYGRFHHYYEVKGEHKYCNAQYSRKQLRRWVKYMHEEKGIPLKYLKIISVAPNYVERVTKK